MKDINLGEYRKGIAGTVAFIGALLAAGVLPDAVAGWGAAIVAGFGAASVIWFPNDDAKGPEPELEPVAGEDGEEIVEVDDDAVSDTGSFVPGDGRSDLGPRA